MRYLFIACALLAGCGNGSSHSSEVSQFVGVWQTTGGSGFWQCSDGTSGNKQVSAGSRWTIGAGTTRDLIVPMGECTASLDVAGNRATGDTLVCEGGSVGVTLTLVVTNNVLTLTLITPWTDSHGSCSETDTILLARVAGN